MKPGDEMESALDARIASTLRGGATSTPEARERVMRAVRASAAPARGIGDDADIAPRGMVVGTVRPRWLSPAFGLLAAASIAGAIALVRALGVEGPIPEVPGQRAVSSHRPGEGSREAVVAASAIGRGGAPSVVEGGVRVASVQFVFVAPSARRVAVVGDFNDWDVTAAPLTSAGGVWSRQLDVPFGRHGYAFVIDGERWVRDPNAPQAPADEFGAGYSVLVVDESSGAHR